MVKYPKITPKNYKDIIKEWKEKNVFVYTERGKRKRASEVKFTLLRTTKGNYTIMANVK